MTCRKPSTQGRRSRGGPASMKLLRSLGPGGGDSGRAMSSRRCIDSKVPASIVAAPAPREIALAPIAQLDRALVYGTRCRKFESSWARKCADRRRMDAAGSEGGGHRRSRRRGSRRLRHSRQQGDRARKRPQRTRGTSRPHCTRRGGRDPRGRRAFSVVATGGSYGVHDPGAMPDVRRGARAGARSSCGLWMHGSEGGSSALDVRHRARCAAEPPFGGYERGAC
jgi:hypothetical protein